MTKMTFTAVQLVRVNFKFENDGFICRFLRFQKDQDIYPKARGLSAGDGIYIAFFTAEEATKIETWLTEQGAKRDSR